MAAAHLHILVLDGVFAEPPDHAENSSDPHERNHRASARHDLSLRLASRRLLGRSNRTATEDAVVGRMNTLRVRALDLVAMLAALIAGPHKNLVLHHGVLAANLLWRTRVVRHGRGLEHAAQAAAVAAADADPPSIAMHS